MKSNRYILPACAVAVAAALVFLVVQVRATPAVDVDDKKLARAEEAYKRRSSGSSPTQATKTVKKPRKRRNTVRATPRVNTAPPARNTEPPAANEPSSSDHDKPTLSMKAPAKDLTAMMNAANKAYDRSDYPTAEEAALEILKDHPRNIRMLRIVVSTSCIMGNEEQAKQHIGRLPARDQAQMRTRCDKWGVELPLPEGE